MSETPTRTPLSSVLSAMETTKHGFAVTVPSDWLQGRAIYGGLSAALCLQATLNAFQDLPPLRSAQLSFIGPATSAVEVVPTEVRRGKSAAFITADLFSEGRLAVRATFCFGKARESRISKAELAGPKVARPEACQPFFRTEFAPNFAQHFNSRLAEGALVVTGSDKPAFTVWLQHRDARIDSVMVGLVALADALPPAAMTLFEDARPISTMTWMFDVLQETPETEGDWWLCRSAAEVTRDGYSTQAMRIWNSRGEPVVIGRQNIAIFA